MTVALADDEPRLNRLERKIDDIQASMVRREDFARIIDKVDQAVPRTEYDSRHAELRAIIERVDNSVRAGFEAASLARETTSQILKTEFEGEFKDHENRLRDLERSRIPERVVMTVVMVVCALIGVFGGKFVHP